MGSLPVDPLAVDEVQKIFGGRKGMAVVELTRSMGWVAVVIWGTANLLQN